MKLLKAEHDVPGLKKYNWPIDKLFWMLDPCAAKDEHFMESISKSLDNGMLYPILVAKRDIWKEFFLRTSKRIDLFPKPIDIEEEHRVVLGNNRCHYAWNNGYTHIEGVYTDDLDRDKMHYLRETSVSWMDEVNGL